MVAGRGVKAGEAFIKIVADTSALQKGLKKAQARLNAFGSAARQMGLKFIALGTALSVPFVLGAKEAIAFETALARIDVLLKKDSKSLGEFKSEIIGLSQEFGVEKSELVGGLEDILQASIEASKATSVLRTALKLSAIGFTDVRTAADALTTIINSYGLDANKAGQISDELFTIVRRGKITFQELAQNIGNVASVAAASGISVEEMGAAIALMTRKGTRAEIAITSLRATLVTFLNPQKAAIKLAKQYGLELSQAQLNNEGLFKSLKKISGLPADVISKIFPNVRALKAVLAITNDVDEFGDDVKALLNSAGTTEERFKKISKLLSFLLGRLKQFGKNLFLIIGDSLRQDIENIANALVNVSRSFAVVLKKSSKLIPVFAKTAVAVVAIGISLLAVATASLTAAFAFGIVANVIGVLVGTIAFLFSPIGALIGLIVILGVTLEKEFGLIKRATSKLMVVFMSLKKTFKDALGSILRSLKAGNITGAFRVIAATVKVLWIKFTTGLLGIWAGFGIKLQLQIVQMGTDIILAWHQIFSGIQSVFAKFKVSFQNGFASIKANFLSFINDLLLKVDILASKIVEALNPDQKAGVADQVIADDTAKAEARKTEIQNEFKQSVLKNNSEADQELEDIKKAGKAKSETLFALARLNKALIKQGSEQRLKAARAELAVAERELKVAIEKSKVRTKKGEGEGGDATTGTVRKGFDELKKLFNDLQVPVATGEVSDKLSARGSFSAVGIERGGSTITFQRDLLSKQQDAIDELRNIKRNTRQNAGAGSFQ